MNSTEPIKSFNHLPLKLRRNLSMYEQYDHLHEEFYHSMFRSNLLPVSVLKPFFGVVEENTLFGSNAYMPIATDPLPFDQFYLMVINRSYLLVGIEIYTHNEIDYQSRFLVEVGYSVSGAMRDIGRIHREILSSICDLENFIRKFKEWCDDPYFVWEMSFNENG